MSQQYTNELEHCIDVNAGLMALVQRAVAVLHRHAPPDGLADHDALTEFYGIFDGPEYREVIAKLPG